MNRFPVVLIALAFGAGLLPSDSEAAGRLGGGRSLGAQRQAVTPQKATPPAQQAQPAAPQSQPQPTGPSRWLAPLPGLAAGIGLGWLFAQGGFGALLATLAMALAAVAVVMLVLRMLRARSPERPTVRYAGPGNGPAAAPPPSQAWGAEPNARPEHRSEVAHRIPAGFDVDGFLRQAKRNFLALQDANDRGDAEALREVTTPEMFEALADDIRTNAGTRQQTDVVTLHADLLEVVTESAMHWASVRFHGTIREDARALPVEFEEIWNLRKPVDGSTGWLLAGIQQTA